MTDDIVKILNNIESIEVNKILNKEELKLIKRKKYSFAIEVSIEIESVRTIFVIAFDDYFPEHFPHIFIDPSDKFGFIPHIDVDGYVCYINEYTWYIDRNNIEGLFYEIFDKVKQTIIEGIKGINSNDFIDEFEDYWKRNKKCDSKTKFISLVQIENSPKKIIYKEIQDKKQKYIFFGDNSEELNRITDRFYGKPTNKTIRTCLYIPIENSNFLPPKYDEFWSIKTLKTKLKNCIPNYKYKNFLKLCKNKFTPDYLIIAIIYNERISVIGIQIKYTNLKGYNPFKSDKRKNLNLIPFKIERMDKGFILPRGGADEALSEKKVLIIGCGALGSAITENIVKTGVQHISLVDDDKIEAENYYRHTIGMEYQDINKANALKRKLKKNFPYATIHHYENRIEHLIKNKEIDFKKYDLVIIAIAHPTYNRFLNEYLHKLNNAPPFIITWIEPYGIGGHAILSNNKEQKGCYSCLFKRNINRATFSKISKEKPFTKAMAGCANVFTPFGVLDAQQTSIYAVRLAMDCLLGKELDNPILSWKGDCTKYKEDGFELAGRYFLSNDKLFDTRYSYKDENCKICQKSI